MERTRESMRVMVRARKDLKSVFEYAIEEGIEPDGFCYVVNEAATNIALRHVIEAQINKSHFEESDHDKV